MSNTYKAITLAATPLFCAATMSAQVLMFDFGPTTTNIPLSNPLNTENGFNESTWNKVQLADISSGLLYSNNNAATGIGINLGIGSSTSINLSTQPGSESALGNGSVLGIYSNDTLVGTDAIFGTTTSNPGVGAQITGLAAGTYDVYVTARNTNVGVDSDDYSQSIYVGASAAGNFNYSAYDSETLEYADPNPANAASNAWVDGENYSKFTITLSAGQALNVATMGIGTSAAAERGFLNSIQVVAIPEPGTYAALFGALALTCVIIRRRRK